MDAFGGIYLYFWFNTHIFMQNLARTISMGIGFLVSHLDGVKEIH